MNQLHKILILIVLVFPAAAASQNGPGNIRVSLATASRTVDGKAARDKSTERSVAVMNASGGTREGDVILAAVFEQEIGPDVEFRVKVDNRTGKEWSFLLVAKSHDKSCSSLLPFRMFSEKGLVNDREVPVMTIEAQDVKESEWYTEDAAGVQRFAVLASTDPKKLQEVFMSVEFIAGLATGRSAPRSRSLEEIKLSQSNDKTGAFEEYTVHQRSITITLGSIYSESGQALRSPEYYDALLLIAECRYQYDQALIPFDALRVGWLNNRALANYQIGELARAKSDYETAIELIEKLRTADQKPRTHERVVALTNLAQVYATLGDQTGAIDRYRSAEKLADALPPHVRDVSLVPVYAGLGTSLEFNGKFSEALAYYEKALPLIRTNRMGASEGIVLNSLGRLAANAGRRVEAEKYFKDALAVSARMGNPAGIGSASNNLGYFYIQEKRYEDAVTAFTRSSEIFADLGNRTAQATALGNLMFVERLQNRSQVAAFYGKRAIRLLESVRGGLTTLEKQLQRSFLLSREETYRSLADILISLDRFLEAEKVLDLLKVQEYSGLAAKTRSGEDAEVLPYTEAENQLNNKVDSLAQLRRERDQLQAEKTRLGEAFTDDAKLTAIADSIPEAARAFRTTLANLGQSQASVSKRVDEILGARNLQSTLSALKASHKTEAVAIYTVIGTEEIKDAASGPRTRTKFGWAILVTPEYRKAYPIDVSSLEETVMRFRQAVRSDRYDPKPEAIKLYNAIFRQTSAKQKTTLEADLADALSGSENRTVMWSLDGVLRYVPMAALHDGKKYLVEKYRNVVFTPQSLIQLQAVNNPQWTVLGLGVSEARPGFSALSGAKEELEFIVRPAMFAGTVLLNQQFTKKETLRMWRSGKYPVIHIASHFKFDAAQPEQSFLLVGDGELRLADFDEDNIFGSVDLLALSACDTAMSNNGKESESFPYRAQDLGAKTVLASLWPVSDAGTPELMTRFYSLRATDPAMTKGEAFHRAQVSLLRGESISGVKSPAGKAANRSEPFAGGGNGNMPQFQRDEARPFAHPYYWAPFILIGNWR